MNHYQSDHIAHMCNCQYHSLLFYVLLDKSVEFRRRHHFQSSILIYHSNKKKHSQNYSPHTHFNFSSWQNKPFIRFRNICSVFSPFEWHMCCSFAWNRKILSNHSIFLDGFWIYTSENEFIRNQNINENKSSNGYNYFIAEVTIQKQWKKYGECRTWFVFEMIINIPISFEECSRNMCTRCEWAQRDSMWVGELSKRLKQIRFSTLNTPQNSIRVSYWNHYIACPCSAHS